MEMDRQTLLVVFGTIIVLTLIGVSWLAMPPMERPLNQPVYSQDDVRLKFQQQAHSRRGLKSPPPDETGSNDAGSREESAEEPPAEEPDAEEPSIEDDNN